MRRPLLIFAALVVLTGIGAVIYLFFFSGTPAVTVSGGSPGTLPSAGQAATTAQTTGGLGGTPIAGPSKVTSRLIEISSGPVVPGTFTGDTKAVAGSSTTPATPADIVVRYIERQSGNVFAYSHSAGAITRTSNRTIPGIIGASWLPDGSVAFAQYLSGTDLSTVNTYALRADGTDGFFMPQGLAGIAVSSTSVLALASGVNGSAVSQYHVDGTHASELFTTPLSSIAASFAGKNQYLVWTKPSATLSGDAYLVSAKGVFSRIAGPMNGLSALASPSGHWVLVSYVQGSALAMELVDTVTHTATPLPVATIAPDKCVWASDESAAYCGIPAAAPQNYAYPDDWYQGAVRFDDRIWKISVNGRYAALVLDFKKDTSQSLDAVGLSVDANQSWLTFVNKRDGSLWGYSL